MTAAQQAQQAPQAPAGNLSLAQLHDLARQAGFTGGDVDTIAAIAYYESNQGDPNAVHVNRDGSLDKGILQINSVWDSQIPDGIKFNPLYAFQAAFHTIVPAQGFSAWTSYTGGQYKQYLTGAGGSATDSLAGASVGVNLGPTRASAAAPLGPMGPAAPAASSNSKPSTDCWFSVPIPGVGPIGGGSVCVPNPISGVGSALSGAASGLQAWWARENVIQRSIALVVGLGLLAVGAAALVLATSGVNSSDVRTAAGVVGKAAVVAG